MNFVLMNNQSFCQCLELNELFYRLNHDTLFSANFILQFQVLTLTLKHSRSEYLVNFILNQKSSFEVQINLRNALKSISLQKYEIDKISFDIVKYKI